MTTPHDSGGGEPPVRSRDELWNELFMSAATFKENILEIIATVEAILQNPESRRRFERAAIYTAKTGELLARVLETNHGLVIVLYGWLPEGAWDNAVQVRPGDDVSLPHFALVDETASDASISYFRKTVPVMSILPLTGRLDRTYPLASRSRKDPHKVTEEDLLRHMSNIPRECGHQFEHECGLRFG